MILAFEDNARKRANGLKKQCMVGIDIYEFVLSKGFKVSYSGVCKYIKEVKNADKPSSKEAFISGYHPPGGSCEFDWGEVKLYIQGKLQRFYMLFLPLAIAMVVMPGSSVIKTPWLLWSL